ncbi:TM0106 family RecB-like putative nuclease [Caenispirillum bisanense]|uniref:AAA+ ATPase domain-containing protein n=1 Tax=Caenispirillum bisanense TaxID=414052 RepID=A0A286GDP3_9PROT|nr:TM0106 family RecB-like putative nuclease [Caenispirillum bisanense]SOD93269.1 uncharacterized protein SAMN05421508_10310 [Caenispirillum bisanense]
MRRTADTIAFSAHDLVNALGCRHRTFLDLGVLNGAPPPPASPDDQAALLREKGLEVEGAVVEALRRDGLEVETIGGGSFAEREALTTAAMRAGKAAVHGAAIAAGRWFGYCDLLVRVERPSGFGAWSYEPVEIKLARRPAAKHVVQLATYGMILSALQEAPVRTLRLTTGDGKDHRLPADRFRHYVGLAGKRLASFVDAGAPGTEAEPCGHCGVCPWHGACSERWQAEDHLSLVANIQRGQIVKLRAAGITTVAALGGQPEDTRIRKMAPDTFARLRHQAALQVRGRDEGRPVLDILPPEDGRGFARLPRPDDGDLYFDIEGDPLYPDGLEYLFGVAGGAPDAHWFRAFWGHDHDEERYAFEALMDFFAGHFAKHPDAHVYHYNHYEVTALKRLASRYGTREAVLDDFLRRRRFVDLYTVVREAIRVSEPRYSLKNIEVFYSDKRSGGVTNAADSVVMYERWRQTQHPSLLRDIQDYNEFDCVSTLRLHRWLCGLRPSGAAWATGAAATLDEERAAELADRDAEREEMLRRLLDGPPSERPLRTLTGYLLGFHRRCEKPEWWAMFDRQERTPEELVDDADCLGDLRQVGPAGSEKKSLVGVYRFPEQETKLRAGDRPLIAQTLEPAGVIDELDEERRLVRLKRGAVKGPLPETLSLVPGGPVNSGVLQAAVERFAGSLMARDGRFRAVRDLLERKPPRLCGRAAGAPVVPAGADVVEGAIAAALAMDETYLFIQGPPGAGKTYTSAHVICGLIRAGFRVGIASNSHKAINNLLHGVEKRAKAQGLDFRGQKKSTAGKADSFLNGDLIEDIVNNADVDPRAALVAGTAWLFAGLEEQTAVDYLFVDEAGQVSLANIVAMGTAARNIVLVGDQMQLGQPIQGVHPGDSGLSVLDFLLRDEPVIPPDRGIFLPTTFRMHRDVCRFISDAVYAGALQSAPSTERQTLLLTPDAHPELLSTGLRFIEAEHEGCSQKSEEEGAILRDLFDSLLRQRRRDEEGRERPLTVDDILVVSPYNVQVNHLLAVLPPGARVGTVDKFQGQEADVVLISMATSSAEDLPRDIDFLYSRNRLNVAISRARCLAVLVASPRLLEIPCRTVEELALVNTLCWAREYAAGQEGREQLREVTSAHSSRLYP